jgi:chaperonin GroES
MRMSEDHRRHGAIGKVDLGLELDAIGDAQHAAFHTVHATVDVMEGADKQPIKMLNDRLLVAIPQSEGERMSKTGLLIPATAQVSKRLAWAEVVAVGPNVRTVESGDHVLFNPEDRFEVDVQGDDYIILRERDIHAVASVRLEGGSTGLYL